MSRRVSAVLVVLLAAAPRVAADDDPLRSGVAQLRTAVDALGAPRAGEVASETEALAATLAGLTKRARDLAREQASLASDIDRRDTEARHLEARRAQAELDEKSIERDAIDLNRRIMLQSQEAAAQRAAAAAAVTDAERQSVMAWRDDGMRRDGLLEAEAAVLRERGTALEQRRADLEADSVTHALSAIPLQQRIAILDREVALTLRECSAALSRALALSQIRNAPAGAAAYRSPRALADEAAGDIFEAIGTELALKSLDNLVESRAVNGRIAVKLLARVGISGGLRATAPGLAYTAAEIMLDYAIAGVDLRTQEVARNVFLIGEYGAVMKQMIQAQGGAATQDPAYLAMRAELQRLAADLPKDRADVILEGLWKPAAIMTALFAVAGNYVGGHASRAGAKITDRLSEMERATLGPGGVKFFRQKLEALSSAYADQFTQMSARASARALADAYEARSEK